MSSVWGSRGLGTIAVAKLCRTEQGGGPTRQELVVETGSVSWLRAEAAQGLPIRESQVSIGAEAFRGLG